MKETFSVARAMNVLEILGEHPYSLLWDLTDDFRVNGHIIEVKRSHQLFQVIIDGKYEYVGGEIVINVNGRDYTSLENVRRILQQRGCRS